MEVYVHQPIKPHLKLWMESILGLSSFPWILEDARPLDLMCTVREQYQLFAPMIWLGYVNVKNQSILYAWYLHISRGDLVKVQIYCEWFGFTHCISTDHYKSIYLAIREGHMHIATYLIGAGKVNADGIRSTLWWSMYEHLLQAPHVRVDVTASLSPLFLV